MRFLDALLVPLLIAGSSFAQQFEVRLLDQVGALSEDAGQRVIRGGAAVGHGGHAANDLVPVSWDEAGAVTVLPLLAGHEVGDAYGLNASGTVVGSSVDVVQFGDMLQLYSSAVAWQGGVVIDLTQEIVSGPQYQLQTATDVNASGRVIGVGFDPVASRSRAWILLGGTLTDLGSLTPSGILLPFALSDANRVAGYATTASGHNHAILWEHGVLRDLHVLGAVPGGSSRGFGLNEAGSVVGAADFSVGGSELERAALWPASGGLVDLGTLGGQESWAHAMSTHGDIVGTATTALNSVAATLWRNGIIHDLNASISPASGWYLLEARDIADDGRIVGAGTFQGAIRGFQLVPECESCTNYCVAAPNSTAQGALISTTGWESVSANFFELHAGPIPPGNPGQFFYGTQAEQVPFGNGFRCVGGTLFRLPVTTGNGQGVLTSSVDFENPPSQSGLIVPGSTWHFQAFYRDPAAGGANFNLSDGLQVTFLP